VHQGVAFVLDSDEQLAKRVLDEEDAINELQIEIDDRVLQVLALHQLMATDLRLVLAVSRINNDLETHRGPSREYRAVRGAHIAGIRG